METANHNDVTYEHALDDPGDWLTHCRVCNGSDGSMPTHCPGRRLEASQKEAIYAGSLDFIAGSWHHKQPPTSVNGLPKPYTKIELTKALVINAPGFFEDPAFIAWLNSSSTKFTWHIKGNLVADEYSDVVVSVDPSLTGEGSDSDMPDYIWQQIIEACKQHIGAGSCDSHILVRITNLSEALEEAHQ